ncbi:putative ribonuclease h protein [Quercus suber]|uniref:Ribonuclease h protein n=1 Tax=Quercus suber TaxID=58331 RepID=A0AAW0LYC1_QUESU
METQIKVRSGTRFITADQATTPQKVSTQPGDVVWKLIWNLNVQSKVRNFLWRTCQNALSVKQNLRRRHIINEDVCDLCKHETESVFHALWGCEQLSQVWGTLFSFSFRQTRTFSSIQEVLLYADKEQKNPKLLASVMWTLWHRRNRVRTSSADFPLAQLLSQGRVHYKSRKEGYQYHLHFAYFSNANQTFLSSFLTEPFPKGIGRLTSLRTLEKFIIGGINNVGECKLGELKNLVHLKGSLAIGDLENALLNQKSNEKHILCWRKFARMDACLENTHKRKACILYRILTNERSARLKSLNPEECMWFSCPLD